MGLFLESCRRRFLDSPETGLTLLREKKFSIFSFLFRFRFVCLKNGTTFLLRILVFLFILYLQSHDVLIRLLQSARFRRDIQLDFPDSLQEEIGSTCHRCLWIQGDQYLLLQKAYTEVFIHQPFRPPTR